MQDVSTEQQEQSESIWLAKPIGSTPGRTPLDSIEMGFIGPLPARIKGLDRDYTVVSI